MIEDARIVVVDDDPIMRELAQTKLVDAGYSARLCANGAEALDAVRRHGADLVITDIDMPELDGFDLTREIRSDARLSDTPVIVITSTEVDDAVDLAFAAGANSFLSKPINWSLFHHSVRFVLRASKDQKALRIARDQAEAGARFKDDLMSLMSHELRTPLNAIIGFGQLLGEHFDKHNENLNKEYSDYIVEGGKKLLNSVSDMLLASEARAGAITISDTDTTVGDLISDALAPLEKSIGIAGAEIIQRLEDPELELCCDKGLLARAIGKLVENSVKFAQTGVKVVIGTAKTPAGDLAILVKDNGPGIAPDRLLEITVPFNQSGETMERSKDGLGLGVPLVQAIASAHGGRFKLEATPKAGARAVIVVPAVRVCGKAKEFKQRIA